MLKNLHFCSSRGRRGDRTPLGAAEPCPTTSVESHLSAARSCAVTAARRRTRAASGLVASSRAEAFVIAEYDVVVVGAGAAGDDRRADRRQRGLRCVVVEKARPFGGSAGDPGAGNLDSVQRGAAAAWSADTWAAGRRLSRQGRGGTTWSDRQRAFLANVRHDLLRDEQSPRGSGGWGLTATLPEFPAAAERALDRA